MAFFLSTEGIIIEIIIFFTSILPTIFFYVRSTKTDCWVHPFEAHITMCIRSAIKNMISSIAVKKKKHYFLNKVQLQAVLIE